MKRRGREEKKNREKSLKGRGGVERKDRREREERARENHRQASGMLEQLQSELCENMSPHPLKKHKLGSSTIYRRIYGRPGLQTVLGKNMT